MRQRPRTERATSENAGISLIQSGSDRRQRFIKSSTHLTPSARRVAMSSLVATPQVLMSLAGDLENLGATLNAAHAAAVAPTAGIMAAGADEFSAAVSSLFASYDQAF
jgi:hypothetical protein